MTRSKTTFLALVAAQTAHSAEEYLGRLWDVFPPARFVTGLISEDRRTWIYRIQCRANLFWHLVFFLAGASALVFGNGFHVLLCRDRANQRRRSHFVVGIRRRLHPG